VKTISAAALLALTIAAHSAQPSLDLAAGVLGVERIQSLSFAAEGRYFQFGQAPAPV
jgi:hypothetical protein